MMMAATARAYFWSTFDGHSRELHRSSAEHTLLQSSPVMLMGYTNLATTLPKLKRLTTVLGDLKLFVVDAGMEKHGAGHADECILGLTACRSLLLNNRTNWNASDLGASLRWAHREMKLEALTGNIASGIETRVLLQ